MTDTKWLPDIQGAEGPKYRALADALRHDVREGTLEPGTRLPPVRDLAWRLNVTPGTVARAYQIATDAGLLEATVGRGTFVRGTRHEEADSSILIMPEPEAPGMYDLLASRAVEVGQSTVIGERAAQVATSGISFIRYAAEPTDLLPCKQAACDWLVAQGINATVENLVLTEGAQNGIFGALQMILEGRDPVVLTEQLTYPGFRRAIRGCRGRPVAVPSDAEGLIPEALEEACARHPVQAILLSANVHNPTTVHTPMHRREAIAEIARRHDVQVIEDDVYGVSVPGRLPGFDRLCPERAWVTTSLSKCVAAGLRMGFLCCPPGRGQHAPRALRGIGLSTSLLIAGLVENLITTGEADRIRDQVWTELDARRNIAAEKLQGLNFHSRRGLNFIWIPLPPAWRVTAFVTSCERNGVLVAGSDVFTASEDKAPAAIRIALSGPPNRRRLEHALTRVAALLREPPPDLIA
ncbi:PLP-dependent aminotransferase family protein [Oceanicella sp. SM1341]|uniref:aminotransferase-like domain-containing protein n=1 Tax=Oceanicella sp. SM1341 TaxID=1548889 RepID=UPI000E50D155|nr:PLP-dependent aminotransferase family protein [Oceanicella sp. SM1341]